LKFNGFFNILFMFIAIWLVPMQSEAAIFSPAVNFAAGLSPQEVASAYFNGDGKTDMAVANWASNNVSILLGDAAGWRLRHNTYTNGSQYPSAEFLRPYIQLYIHRPGTHRQLYLVCGTHHAGNIECDRFTGNYTVHLCTVSILSNHITRSGT